MTTRTVSSLVWPKKQPIQAKRDCSSLRDKNTLWICYQCRTPWICTARPCGGRRRYPSPLPQLLLRTKQWSIQGHRNQSSMFKDNAIHVHGGEGRDNNVGARNKQQWDGTLPTQFRWVRIPPPLLELIEAFVSTNFVNFSKWLEKEGNIWNFKVHSLYLQKEIMIPIPTKSGYSWQAHFQKPTFCAVCATAKSNQLSINTSNTYCWLDSKGTGKCNSIRVPKPKCYKWAHFGDITRK